MLTNKELTTNSRGLALVVDEVPSNRKILELLLVSEGYQTISAEDGLQAVQLCKQRLPDMVFMDAMMPIVNGYEAAACIKTLAGSIFVPIIFLTSNEKDRGLVECLEAGGDDYIRKPFKKEVLSAKIKAMERIRDLTRRVAEQHQKILEQHNRLVNEQIVAGQIYNRAVASGNIESKHIQFTLRAVSTFSGDMLLSACCPDGALYFFLGDFTGHGLIAAVGVLPTAEVFRAMTAKGFPAQEIIIAINSKLHRLLPTGMFLTACMVVIEKDMKSVTIWNAGMPDVWILGKSIVNNNLSVVKQRIPSRYLALGILKVADILPAPTPIAIESGDRIFLCSDGLTEATNVDRQEFGMQRIAAAIAENSDSFTSVIVALDKFCGVQPMNDDLSVVEIECLSGLKLDGEEQRNS